MRNSKTNQNQIKTVINASYNRLYTQFTSNELTEVGNYKILEHIGDGTFGTVYLALHKPTRLKVVLKSSDRKNPNVVREVFYHRQFDAPYITKLYEVILTETKVWMALEYCSGKELYEHLLLKQQIPLIECQKLFAQIAGAVYYAHSLNCVHRDLKLENILLDEAGNAKLTDFGFTRECATRTQLDTICGTTVYMAPELLEKKKYDGFKVDVWSMGIIFYTLIKGMMPFDNADTARTEWDIINKELEFDPKIFNKPSIDLISQLLSKDACKRPSCEEILKHKFFDNEGTKVLEQIKKILERQCNGTLNFRTKIEKNLLKKLKQSGFDKNAIKSSVSKRKSDSLSGMWYLLLDQENKRLLAQNLKGNKSVLSFKKSKDFSIHRDSPTPNEDDNLGTALMISKSNSVSKKQASTSKVPPQTSKSQDSIPKSQTTSSKSQTSALKVDQKTNPGIKKDKKKEKHQNGKNMLSTHNDQKKGQKGTFLNKVTNFFKNKKDTPKTNQVLSVNRNRSQSEQIRPIPTLRVDTVMKEEFSHQNDANFNPEKSYLKNGENNGSETQGKNHSNTVDQFGGSIPTRTRSKSSSHVLSNTQAPQILNEFQESSKASQNSQPRRVSSYDRPISNFSEISNDTYNSDSTEAKSPVKDSNVNKAPLTPVSNGKSAYLSANRKTLRRDQSIVSTASSASEMSSRTDSFYDLALASKPKNKTFGANDRYNKDINMSNMEAHRTWLPTGGYSRRKSLRRKNSKRKPMHATVTEPHFIIEEETSSNNSVFKDYGGLKLVYQESIPEEDDNLTHQSDGAVEADNVPYSHNKNNSLGASKFKKVRSLSEGSDWSKKSLTIGNKQAASKVFIEMDDDGDDENEDGYESARIAKSQKEFTECDSSIAEIPLLTVSSSLHSLMQNESILTN